MQPCKCKYTLFISEPLLTTNSPKNEPNKVDDGITSIRSASLSEVSTIDLETSSTPTITDSFKTPTTTTTGDVALKVLTLPSYVMTELAIKQYLTFDTVPNEAFSWLLGDIERIKLLLENANIDLSKKNSSDNTLIENAFVLAKTEIFSLLWGHSKDKDKVKAFINCIVASINFHIHLNTDYAKIISVLFESKKINADMFTENEQYILLKKGCEEPSLFFVKKFLGLGFNINAKNEKGESFLEEISKEIFIFALSKKDGYADGWVEESIVRKMNLLQGYFENLNWNALTEENSCKLKYDKNQLDSIAPYLEIESSFLNQAFRMDNVIIGQKIWDKAKDKDRKKALIHYFRYHDNSKLVISLIEDKKVSPDMFTEKEQYDIFFTFRQKIGDGRESEYDYEYNESEFLNKLIDYGFNINAKDEDGKSVVEYCSKEIFKYYLKPDSRTNPPAKVILNNVKFLKQCFEKTSHESMKISTNESFQLTLENISKKSTLEQIAPYLEPTESILIKAFEKGDIKIGTIMWDKATQNDRKSAFVRACSHNKNSELIIALMEDNKVTADMFTEQEQHRVLYNNLGVLLTNNKYNRLECLEKFIEIGFDVKAKNSKGKNIKDFIKSNMNDCFFSTKNKGFYIQALKVIDKALEKAMIELGVILESGRKDEESNLSMFPKDIINEIVNTLVLNNKEQH